MKKTVLDQIRIVKVANGYLVNMGERAFVSLDDVGVKTIIEGELPTLLEELEKKQNTEEPKDARPGKPDTIPETGRPGVNDEKVADA